MPHISKHAYAYEMNSETAAATLDVRSATVLLRALSDDNRLRMVALLARGELCVCHVAAALDLSQPNVSQHLTVLKNAGVVESERRGSWIYYRLVAEQAPARARILGAVLASVADIGAGDGRRLTERRANVACE